MHNQGAIEWKLDRNCKAQDSDMSGTCKWFCFYKVCKFALSLGWNICMVVAFGANINNVGVCFFKTLIYAGPRKETPTLVQI